MVLKMNELTREAGSKSIEKFISKIKGCAEILKGLVIDNGEED